MRFRRVRTPVDRSMREGGEDPVYDFLHNLPDGFDTPRLVSGDRVRRTHPAEAPGHYFCTHDEHSGPNYLTALPVTHANRGAYDGHAACPEHVSSLVFDAAGSLPEGYASVFSGPQQDWHNETRTETRHEPGSCVPTVDHVIVDGVHTDPEDADRLDQEAEALAAHLSRIAF